MRFALLVAAAAAAGCAREAQPPQARCERSASAAVAAIGTATATASGPSCASAVVTLAIRDAAGELLWVHAAAHHSMVAGDPAPEGAPPVAEAEMDRFLAALVDIDVAPAPEMLPPWREGAAAPGEAGSFHAYATNQDRSEYQALLQTGPPVLCYAETAELVRCVALDAGSPARAILSYGR